MWSDSSKSLNENRTVFYQKAKLWIQNFNLSNDSLKASDKPLFTPTTVMEIGNKKYVFVIHKAKLNSKGHVVFKVSTEEIKLSEKKMLKLPCGHHDGVRFDIDIRPSKPILCDDYTGCSCSQIQDFVKSYGIDCEQYNCDNSGPAQCFAASQLGCGIQYAWTSTNKVDVYLNTC